MRQRNDVDGVKNLLDASLHGQFVAQPNAKGLNDWTPLHVASAALLAGPAWPGPLPGLPPVLLAQPSNM